MSILTEIIENKKVEVARSKSSFGLSHLESRPAFKRACNSLTSALSFAETGVIAEFKRKSPSKGDINIGAGISETTTGYVEAGAVGLSVLTDTVYFGGFKEDLHIAREQNLFTPILRKDFMIDSYQFYEAKAWGADVVLLIAAALDPSQIKDFSTLAVELGMQVILEVHNKEELDKSPLDSVDIIGVNNRNLKNFKENNVDASIELSKYIPASKTKISESCIHAPETVKKLKKAGYQGFLVGELFMKEIDPAKALQNFLAAC